MKKTPRWIAAAAIAALMSASAAGQEIKISHQFKANADGRDLATRVFVKEVNARDPNLKFRIYPAQSLGIKPVAQLDAIFSEVVHRNERAAAAFTQLHHRTDVTAW